MNQCSCHSQRKMMIQYKKKQSALMTNKSELKVQSPSTARSEAWISEDKNDLVLPIRQLISFMKRIDLFRCDRFNPLNDCIICLSTYPGYKYAGTHLHAARNVTKLQH